MGMGALYDCYGDAMGMAWEYYRNAVGKIIGILWECYGNTLGTLREDYRNTVRILWE